MPAPSRSSRLAPLLAVTVAGALLVGTASLPSYAASDEPGAGLPTGQPLTVDPTSTDPGTPEQIAEESLDAAEDLVAGDSTDHPTQVLNQLSETLADLPPADRRRAGQILARPTRDGDEDTGENDGLLEYTVAEEAPYCLARVCVHYVATTADRPPMADTAPADGVPDWVQETARVMENVWSREVGRLGYRPPLADGGTPTNDAGPTPGLDVFLGDIGSRGIYGYAASDHPARDTSSAYLALDEDFTNRALGGGDPGDLLRATAAHEFFHAVQFGYDQYEDTWFQESTATWMEERVYDSVNDNRQFLSSSALAKPGRTLDSPIGVTWYGNWIFFEFLSRRLGADVVRSMWSRAARDGIYSTVAISQTLRAENTSLRTRFAGFAAGNLYPARTYAEGRAYRRPPVAATFRLSTASRGTGNRTVKLDHLTSRSYALTAGTSLKGAWRVRLAVNGPSNITGVVAIVNRKDGTLSRHGMRLNSWGNGKMTLPLSRSAVKRVTLTMANTSVRYVCGAGAYSCSGAARDQNKPFTFSARAIR